MADKKARLQKKYTDTIRTLLLKRLSIDNVMAVPRLEKIVVNVGVKEAVGNSKLLKSVHDVLVRITGQLPIKTVARKSIAGFKLRQGAPIGVMVTLRRQRMFEFLDRLINLALPKTRDFRGLKTKFDGRGNYNLGIRESIIFPEIDYSTVDFMHGMNITIETSTTNDDHARELLRELGVPFKTAEQKAR